jgi:hypothetical protein
MQKYNFTYTFIHIFHSMGGTSVRCVGGGGLECIKKNVYPRRKENRRIWDNTKMRNFIDLNFHQEYIMLVSI